MFGTSDDPIRRGIFSFDSPRHKSYSGASKLLRSASRNTPCCRTRSTSSQPKAPRTLCTWSSAGESSTKMEINWNLFQGNLQPFAVIESRWRNQCNSISSLAHLITQLGCIDAHLALIDSFVAWLTFSSGRRVPHEADVQSDFISSGDKVIVGSSMLGIDVFTIVDG